MLPNLFKILLSGLAGSFLLPVFLYAQDEEDPPAREARGRVAYLVCTSIPDDLANPVDVLVGGKLVSVSLSKRSVGEPVKIPEDGIIRVVRKLPNPEEPSKPLFQTLAEARIAEGVAKALVILMPVKRVEGKPIFSARVQDLAAFKGGDYLYLNLSPMNIAVELGKEKIGLKPAEMKIHNAPALLESTNVPTRYSYFHPEKQEWRMLSASTVAMHSTRREICIFSWDGQYERVDYHGITFPVTP